MWQVVSNVGALLGILGVSITNFISDENKAWISLGVITILMVIVGWRVWKVTDHYVKQHYPKGYVPLSASARWTTSDGQNITYELTRHIQIKTARMRSFEQRFCWTGTKLPVVKSDLHTASSITDVPNENLKKFKLTFPQTRIFNDVEIVQFQMQIDDSDEAAETQVTQMVEDPMRLIDFRVELLHMNGRYQGQKATVSRIALDRSINAKDEVLDSIAFDPSTKSFSHKILNPEPGYAYKLAWPRNAVGAAKRTQKKAGQPWKP
ncbi:hypothetical protein N234_18850 [Ralstonia pickettii DTP0602]|nr:hypothetical protein N234_18850 [Ralstonia pickettii DTP0602]